MQTLLKYWCFAAILLAASLTTQRTVAQPQSYLNGRETLILGKTPFKDGQIDLYAYMKPITSDKPIPVVVYVGGCDGWNKLGTAYMQSQMAELENLGYHVIHLDWAGSRGIWNTCQIPLQDPRYTKPQDIANDIYVAYKYLSQHPKIDPKRIGLFGFSAGGGGVLAYSSTIWGGPWWDYQSPGYAAVFAIYGFCYREYTTGNRWTRNIMAVFGELDNEVRPNFCQKVTPEPGVESVIHLFPGVHHGYMLPDNSPPSTTFRPYSQQYVTIAYDAKAYRETWALAKGWFDKYMLK